MLDYYATPNVRALCHQAKTGDPEALLKIAEVLALSVGSNDTITPVPNRQGESGVMAIVCGHIARLTGCTVWDGIRGVARHSQYESKKQGAPLSIADLGLSLKGRPPSTPDRHLIIDIIQDTGTTLTAALSLLPKARPLPFAVVDKQAELSAENSLRQLSSFDTESLVAAFTASRSEREAFAFVHKAVSMHPSAEPALVRQLQKQFPFTQHAGLRAGMVNGFSAHFDLPVSTIAPPEQNDVFGRLVSMSQSFSAVIENHEAGFHFEEGGCWGFAAALHDYAHNQGLPATLVWSQDYAHCYVKVADMLFDHQGTVMADGKLLQDVPRAEIFALAERNGVSRHEVDVDVDWAASILNDAASMLKSERSDGSHNRFRR